MSGFRFWIVAGGIVAVVLGFGVLVFGAAANIRQATQPTDATPLPTASVPAGALASDNSSDRIVQVVGIALLGGGLYYFWRRQRSLYDAIKAREGPTLNTRVRSAVAQLNTSDDQGWPVIEERIHGIEELGKLIQESPRDYWPVMEVLSRYVRQNAPVGDEDGDHNGSLSPDVQMALTVIAGRTHSRRGGDRLDLSNADLRGAQLPGAHLEGVDLSSSRLDGATLVNSHLELADLSGTNLTGADLRGAQGLSRTQLDAAITESSTQLPEDLLP